MNGSIELDNFCAKKLGLSYGQYMALTDEKERAKLYRRHRKEFEAARQESHLHSSRRKKA